MNLRTRAESPIQKRGRGQTSYLLLANRQFGCERLSITWVECEPGSQQPLHAHAREDQVYVIVRGNGRMLVGDETRSVKEGTMVFVPPGSQHAIRNAGADLLVYVSATAPPFEATISARRWRPNAAASSETTV